MTRTEGEYPFYPKKPEHEVLKPAPFILVDDDAAGQQKAIIDHGGQDHTTGMLQGGDGL